MGRIRMGLSSTTRESIAKNFRRCSQNNVFSLMIWMTTTIPKMQEIHTPKLSNISV